jgi:TonB-linked SusC/RagA family outer membrane protein
MKRLILLLTCFVIGMGLSIAQITHVVGTVVDENGEPAIGASITVKGNTAIGAITNVDGQFTLDVPDAYKTLVVKYLGTQDQEVAVAPNISITLKTSSTSLDEVIVVAYGTAKKESFTGSAGVISAKKLEKRTVTNVSKAIEGTVPGVLTTSGSGQPGSGSNIRVRGYGSFNDGSNNPLYVVDGAPYEGSIAAINPNDIESITVLKDAAAGALYGARGANGVILVTTKRGAENGDKLTVDLKAKWGVASRAIPKYNLMNEQEFIEQSFIMFRNDQIYNYGVSPELAGAAAVNAMVNGNNRIFGIDEQYNPYNMPIAQLIDPVTGKVNPAAQLRYHEDWMDAVSENNPLRQEYDLSLRGGTAKTKYYLSLNYLDEEGLLATTSFQRVGGRLNIDSEAKDWLRFGGNASFAYNKSNSLGSSGTTTSNVWYSAQNMGPIYPIHELDENGQIKYDSGGRPIFDYGLYRGPGAQINFNSVALLYEDKYGSQSDNYNLTGYTLIDFDNAKYGWAQGINFKVSANLSTQNATSMTYYNPLFGNAGGATSGRLSRNATRVYSYTFSTLLGYNRKFGDHTIDFIGGHEFYSYKYNNLNASKTGFPFPGLYELNPGAVLASIGSYENNYTIESLLTRFKYSYADKYNFDASYRRDASSRFHPDNRWGDFWSVGANWRISQERFLEDVEWLNNLSLRTSYGLQGNDEVGTLYAWQSFYDLGYPNSSYNGSVLSSLENKDLVWEKNANFNVGLEARLFDSRLSIIAEYFNKQTYDLLLDVPMATSLGFDSYLANVGEVNNHGFELSLGIDIIKSTNFDWNFMLLGSTIKNKVVKLATERPIIGGQIIKVGVPRYSYYLPESAGVDPATGKQLYWVWDKRDPITDERDPDSERYISDDPSKAANSRIVGPTTIPDFFGSISSEFRIFDFDFSFLTTYSLGGKVMDSQYNAYMEPLYRGGNIHKNIQRAWQKPGDITDIPRAEFNSNRTNTLSNLVDASFYSIRNITLGYSLPGKMAKKLGIDNIRVFATGDNLITFTYLDGLDPQSSFTGADSYQYIPIRTISAGINIKF